MGCCLSPVSPLLRSRFERKDGRASRAGRAPSTHRLATADDRRIVAGVALAATPARRTSRFRSVRRVPLLGSRP